MTTFREWFNENVQGNIRCYADSSPTLHYESAVISGQEEKNRMTAAEEPQENRRTQIGLYCPHCGEHTDWGLTPANDHPLCRACGWVASDFHPISLERGLWLQTAPGEGGDVPPAIDGV